MGCCLSLCSEYEVDRVVDKFSKYYSPVSHLQANEFPQLIAGRILPVGVALTAPVSGKRCVHYTVKAEELVRSTRIITDDKGYTRVEELSNWVCRYIDTREVDFLLIDPANPTVHVYVPFAQFPHKLHCKVDSTTIGFPPNSSRPSSFLDMFNRCSFTCVANEWRYTESSFEYGEQVAVLAVIRHHNESGTKVAHPVTGAALTEAFFKENGWSSWDVRSWRDLTQSACLIVTDVPQFLKNTPIAPLSPQFELSVVPQPVCVVGGAVAVLQPMTVFSQQPCAPVTYQQFGAQQPLSYGAVECLPLGVMTTASAPFAPSAAGESYGYTALTSDGIEIGEVYHGKF